MKVIADSTYHVCVTCISLLTFYYASAKVKDCGIMLSGCSTIILDLLYHSYGLIKPFYLGDHLGFSFSSLNTDMYYIILGQQNLQFGISPNTDQGLCLPQQQTVSGLYRKQAFINDRPFIYMQLPLFEK